MAPCSACQSRRRARPRYINDSPGHKHGVAINGESYHIDDLVFIGGNGSTSQIFRKAILTGVIFCEVDTVLEVTLLDTMDNIKRRGRVIPVVGDEVRFTSGFVLIVQCVLVKTTSQTQVGISCVRGKIPITPPRPALASVVPALTSYRVLFETTMEIGLANTRDCRPLRFPYKGCIVCSSAPTLAQRMTAADMYAGAGGLTEGARQTGWIDSKYAIEWDHAAASTLQYVHLAT